MEKENNPLNKLWTELIEKLEAYEQAVRVDERQVAQAELLAEDLKKDA